MSTKGEMKVMDMNEQMNKEIKHFLTKKRSAVINVLAEQGELSQGELALAVNSTVTSLSNILLKFERYQYKLLEVRSSGKYRYYALSDIAKTYLNDLEKQADLEKDSVTSSEGDEKLFQHAEECLEDLKKIHGDEWQTKFDNALVRRIYGSGETLDSKSELLVEQYLKCLEILTMQNNGEVLGEVLALVANSILRDRIESLMNYFEPFIVVLKDLRKKENIFNIGMVLKAAFAEQHEEDVKKYIEELQWKNDEYGKLKAIIPKLKKCLNGCNSREIYQYFNMLLPEQEMLSMCILEWIRN